MTTFMLPERRAVYCTIDDVNLDTFTRLADRRRLAFRHHEPRDGEPSGPAVVLDADSLWPSRDERRCGIDELLGRLVRPAVVAVHGWQLDDEQIARLRLADCIVADRLDGSLLDAVVAALARLPLPVPTA